jgi:hypothetical protein
MLNEFTYTLVSEIDQGGNFFNSCNEILDFQTTHYEVCMQEMLLTVGAWDNVRDGTNTITLMGNQSKITTIKPDHYPTITLLVNGINNAMVGWNGHLVYDEDGKTIEFKGADIRIKFYKKIAFMLGLTPAINMPLPILKIGDKIDTKKIDLYRNTLTILWVLADFIEPTTVSPTSYPYCVWLQFN